MLGCPAIEKSREKCKISQFFREILHFFVKTKGSATMRNFVKKIAKNCNNLYREKKAKIREKTKTFGAMIFPFAGNPSLHL